MKTSLTWSGAALLALVAGSLGPGTASRASAPPDRMAETAEVSPAAAAAPLGEGAVSIARAHVAAHADELGLSAADVDQLAVSSVVPTEHNGLTQVYFQQRVSGIDVATAMLNVAVTSEGGVLRVASSAVASAAKRTNSATPKITDTTAAQLAAEALGLQQTSSFVSGDAARGADRARELGDGGISSEPIPAQLVYERTDDELRLAWELVIDQLDGQHWWQIRMDARTGAELGRTDWVADDDSHRVFPAPVESPSFASPVNTRTLVSNPATAASPFGWNDTNGAAGPESTLTVGNNVKAYTDVDHDNAPDPGSSPDGGAGLAFDFPLDLTQAPSTYRPAAVSNLYFTNNRVHDVLYRYGFDEASGNFQVNNYGHGGAGSDAVNAEAQDGAGVNNANFGTPPDGSAPRMQMFVFDAPVPDRDGDLDNGVIIHEYGHGVSNRLTGGPATVSCLGNQEQAGEGWSDFLSYMLTMPTGTEPAAGRGMGTYVLNQPTNGAGIRTQRYSTNLAVNTETYDSIKGWGGDEHFIGEVWAEMLWEVNWAMVAKYGFTADLDAGNAGNTKTLQLVMDGLKLQPCSPGFVDARDAIIAADQVDNGGANECLLWTAFAKRGLGFSAVQGSTGSVDDGTQAFDSPPYCNGLRVTRSASPSAVVAAGGQITYGFHLVNTNSAPGGLPGVSVTGTVGDHATYVAGSATCGGAYDSGTKTVTFPVGTMAFAATRDCEFKALTDATPSTTTTFVDDFEPDLSAWTTTHAAGVADWSLSTVTPHSPTHSVVGVDADVPSDLYLTLAAPVAVHTGDSLMFWHRRELESTFDGGVVEVSTNGGGSWTDVGAAAFSVNGYNGTLEPGSALAGRAAFTGSTPGYVRSTASLAAYAGQSVLVRFRVATDDGIGGAGWRIDDVVIGQEVATTSAGTIAATGVATQNLDVTTLIVAPVPTPPPPPPVTKTVPGSPVVTKSVALSTKKAKISFTPGSDGGSPVTAYSVSCTSKNGGKPRTATGKASPITVKKLTPGKTYKCKVRATNAVGTGAYGPVGKKLKMPKPQAPQGTHHRQLFGRL